MRYLVLLALACSRPMPATISDGCFNVGVAFCDKGAKCGTLSDVTKCRSDFVVQCCAGNDCSRPVRDCPKAGTMCCATDQCDVIAVDYAIFERCEAGVTQLTCGQLAAGLVPSGCLADGGR